MLRWGGGPSLSYFYHRRYVTVDVTKFNPIFCSPGWADLLDKVAGGDLHHEEEELLW